MQRYPIICVYPTDMMNRLCREIDNGSTWTILAAVENMDQALAFVYAELEKLSCPMKAQMQIGGLGISMVKKSMDEMRYYRREGKTFL